LFPRYWSSNSLSNLQPSARGCDSQWLLAVASKMMLSITALC
jgi:hypothetical protein